MGMERQILEPSHTPTSGVTVSSRVPGFPAGYDLVGLFELATHQTVTGTWHLRTIPNLKYGSGAL